MVLSSSPFKARRAAKSGLDVEERILIQMGRSSRVLPRWERRRDSFGERAFTQFGFAPPATSARPEAFASVLASAFTDCEEAVLRG